MSKQRMAGFQKPLSDPKPDSVSMPVISTDTGTLLVPVISCSCGWAFGHRRTKVREDAAEKHANKKHGGRALWV